MIHKKNILFICKYNVFRSRIAEAYFNKTNKNKKWVAKSAGIIPGFSVNKNQKQGAKKFGITISGKSKGINIDLLKIQDLIIIVADDVSKEIFNWRGYKDKLIVWKIKDASGKNKKSVQRAIKAIIKKANSLVKMLGNKK